jgi:CO/xanthine dehydrogenase Mo-binding subunit
VEKPCFVEDIFFPHMLYAVTLRSPVAKGRLMSVNCPKLPHNCLLIRAEDIPGANFLEDSNMPLLASDELSYIGEPVALLIGPDRNFLGEYAKNCKVIAGEEEPVFSASPFRDSPFRDNDTGAAGVLAEREFRIGNAGAVFAETALAETASVVRGCYRTGIQGHWYAEPTGAVAWFEQHKQEDGEDEKESKRGKKKAKTVVVCTATQWPHHVRRSVARALGLPAASVLVNPTLTGLHMDGKFWYPSLVACHAALGAWIAKNPVKMILSRAEDFAFSPKRCGTEIHIASALDGKGEITGMEIKAAVNIGAYGINAAEIIDQTCLGSLGFYKIKNITFSGAAYKTNIPPQGPFAGFGMAQGSFALERHISCVADMCRQDPAQWRVDNISKTVPFLRNLPVKNAASPDMLVDMAVKMSDYSRKWASYELLRQNWRQRRQRAHDAPAAELVALCHKLQEGAFLSA